MSLCNVILEQNGNTLDIVDVTRMFSKRRLHYLKMSRLSLEVSI